MIDMKARPTTSATTPSSLPICEKGTRPMIIIMQMTRQRSAAVDRFSKKIRGTMSMPMNKIYLNAFLSAPRPVCMALRICAVAST